MRCRENLHAIAPPASAADRETSDEQAASAEQAGLNSRDDGSPVAVELHVTALPSVPSDRLAAVESHRRIALQAALAVTSEHLTALICSRNSSNSATGSRTLSRQTSARLCGHRVDDLLRRVVQATERGAESSGPVAGRQSWPQSAGMAIRHRRQPEHRRESMAGSLGQGGTLRKSLPPGRAVPNHSSVSGCDLKPGPVHPHSPRRTPLIIEIDSRFGARAALTVSRAQLIIPAIVLGSA